MDLRVNLIWLCPKRSPDYALGLYPPTLDPGQQTYPGRDLQLSCSSTTSLTGILPRVAFEYGQTLWASSTSFSAVAFSTPGMKICSSTSRPKPPCPVGPMPTLAVIVVGPASTCWRRTTSSSADWKQAA